jgi:hypothetical protein
VIREIRLRLDIPPERLLAWYRGDAAEVQAVASDGRRVRFPARVLQPFVTREGIRGEFVLRYDAQSRFVDIRKLP